MKREITDIKLEKNISRCCPGCDPWPCGTYRTQISKKARTRDKKREHRFVRRKKKTIINHDQN